MADIDQSLLLVCNINSGVDHMYLRGLHNEFLFLSHGVIPKLIVKAADVLPAEDNPTY